MNFNLVELINQLTSNFPTKLVILPNKEDYDKVYYRNAVREADFVVTQNGEVLKNRDGYLSLESKKAAEAEQRKSIEDKYLESLQRQRYKHDAKLIMDMKIGDVGYTTLWAVNLDKDGYAWINGNYDLDTSIHGTVQLKVERTEFGFVATIIGNYDFNFANRDSAGFRKWSNIPLVRLNK